MKAQTIYDGSDGAATRNYLRSLEVLGPDGMLAAALFRAQKASFRAKKYRGGIGGGSNYVSYRELAYERKQECLNAVASLLLGDAKGLGITWGWGTDSFQTFNTHVLYLELPQGQVSFHSPQRGPGPKYEKPWDGLTASCARILAYCDAVEKNKDCAKQERLCL
jgi:hypothetical protein